MNSSIAPNRTRSANAPMMSAGVMIAKVSWNMANTVSGMEPVSAPRGTFARNALPSPPTTAFTAGFPAGVNASEYPTATQSTVTTDAIEKHCIRTERTFFVRTRPP